MRLRSVVKILCLLAVWFLPAAQTLAAGCLAYVGTYTGKGSEGIYVYRFDPTTGEASSVGLAAAADNPSFLAVDPGGRFLYAVNEIDTFRDEDSRKEPTGAISVFAIDRESGRLKLLQQVSSLGKGPAHVSLDRSARYLMVANYDGGNVAVFPVERDGRLGRHTAFVQHAGSSVNPERQAGPHAHFVHVTPDNRFVIAADLGLDRFLVYRFDATTGSLSAASPGFVAVEPGAGPRHVAFAPSGKVVYGLNELASTVTAFAFHADQGSLHAKQTITTLPEGFAGKNTAAEIVVDAEGRFLYVSNRGHDSIAVFSIDPDSGNLKILEWVSSGGRTPRHFVIDPTGQWLLAANQDSDRMALFRINPGNGRLTATDRSLQVSSPVCTCFVTLE
jgi:6-phosphogluconolactonase